MGTRCDFYRGRGEAACYLGSIGHDAFVEEMAEYFAGVTTWEAFEAVLARVFADYGEIPAANGWPWPWRDSHTTDTVVAFDEGQVWTEHHSGFWSPLADYDVPTPVRCVHPDMVQAEEATPSGRLRRALRHSGRLALGPQTDVMSWVLCRAAYLLARVGLHVVEREGACLVLARHWERNRSASDLYALGTALRTCPEELELLLAEKAAAPDDVDWGLLRWLSQTGGSWSTVTEPPTTAPELPLYFGYPPTPEVLVHYQGPWPYLRLVEGESFTEGRRRLDLVLDRLPVLYVKAVIHELYDTGGLPVSLEEAEAWVESPQAGLDGLSLAAASETAAGREQARQWAAQLFYGD